MHRNSLNKCNFSVVSKIGRTPGFPHSLGQLRKILITAASAGLPDRHCSAMVSPGVGETWCDTTQIRTQARGKERIQSCHWPYGEIKARAPLGNVGTRKPASSARAVRLKLSRPSCKVACVPTM